MVNRKGGGWVGLMHCTLAGRLRMVIGRWACLGIYKVLVTFTFIIISFICMWFRLGGHQFLHW